jgi:hypothetical protein
MERDGRVEALLAQGVDAIHVRPDFLRELPQLHDEPLAVRHRTLHRSARQPTTRQRCRSADIATTSVSQTCP